MLDGRQDTHAISLDTQLVANSMRNNTTNIIWTSTNHFRTLQRHDDSGWVCGTHLLLPRATVYVYCILCCCNCQPGTVSALRRTFLFHSTLRSSRLSASRKPPNRNHDRDYATAWNPEGTQRLGYPDRYQPEVPGYDPVGVARYVHILFVGAISYLVLSLKKSV